MVIDVKQGRWAAAVDVGVRVVRVVVEAVRRASCKRGRRGVCEKN